jgi:hypothetical protein
VVMSCSWSAGVPNACVGGSLSDKHGAVKCCAQRFLLSHESQEIHSAWFVNFFPVPLSCKQVCLQPSHNRLDCELSRCTVCQIYILEQLVLMERMCSCVVCHSLICQELMIASLTMLLNSWLLSAGLRMTHG